MTGLRTLLSISNDVVGIYPSDHMLGAESSISISFADAIIKSTSQTGSKCPTQGCKRLVWMGGPGPLHQAEELISPILFLKKNLLRRAHNLSRNHTED